jgi:hypothetical protein
MTKQNNSETANQTCPPRQSLTEEKIKEIVMETLIELDLVPKAKKKKAITPA